MRAFPISNEIREPSYTAAAAGAIAVLPPPTGFSHIGTDNTYPTHPHGWKHSEIHIDALAHFAPAYCKLTNSPPSISNCAPVFPRHRRTR